MLYIMRHGQTDWNLQWKLQGQTDIPLNENGRKMAREAGERYQNLRFDICYSSPLTRARETAELVLAGRNVPILTDERLKEMNFGIYEGDIRITEQPEHPIGTLFQAPDLYAACGGAETLEALYARTGEFLMEIAAPELAQGKNVLIVGHGAMNLSIINRLLKVPVAHYWDRLPGNCEMLEFADNLVIS